MPYFLNSVVETTDALSWFDKGIILAGSAVLFYLVKTLINHVKTLGEKRDASTTKIIESIHDLKSVFLESKVRIEHAEKDIEENKSEIKALWKEVNRKKDK